MYSNPQQRYQAYAHLGRPTGVEGWQVATSWVQHGKHSSNLVVANSFTSTVASGNGTVSAYTGFYIGMLPRVTRLNAAGHLVAGGRTACNPTYWVKVQVQVSGGVARATVWVQQPAGLVQVLSKAVGRKVVGYLVAQFGCNAAAVLGHMYAAWGTYKATYPAGHKGIALGVKPLPSSAVMPGWVVLP